MCPAPHTAAAPLQQEAALRPHRCHQVAAAASSNSSSSNAPRWRRWLQTATGWTQVKVQVTPLSYLQPFRVQALTGSWQGRDRLCRVTLQCERQRRHHLVMLQLADGVPVQMKLPGLLWTHQWTVGSRSSNSSSKGRQPQWQARQRRRRRCQLPAWTRRTGRHSPRPPQRRLRSRRRRLCSSRAAQPSPLSPPQQRMPLRRTPTGPHKAW